MLWLGVSFSFMINVMVRVSFSVRVSFAVSLVLGLVRVSVALWVRVKDMFRIMIKTYNMAKIGKLCETNAKNQYILLLKRCKNAQFG